MQIDEPKFRFSIRQNYLPNVEGFYYMRLHGRNADEMVAARQVGGSLQLPVFGRRADRSSRKRRQRRDELVKKTYLYTNNHFSAKSVANAAMIKQQLGEPIEGEYPPEFIERYPELAGAVNCRPTLLGPASPVRRA